MAYLAVNKDGKEVRFDGRQKPLRIGVVWVQYDDTRMVEGHHHCSIGKTQPFGTILSLTGKKITFDDEPIKI